MLLTTVADPTHGDLYHPSAPIAGAPDLSLDVLVLHELGGWALWVVAKLVGDDRSLCIGTVSCLPERVVTAGWELTCANGGEALPARLRRSVPVVENGL